MPLRAHPADPTPRPPSLSANDSLEGGRPLVVLEGEAIGKLSRPARRRLLATALAEPRVRPLGLRARGASLFLYLSLETPAHALVASWSDQATGVVRRDGRSLALVRGWEQVDRITAYGGPEAEQQLARLVERWRKLGCPSEDDLSIEVGFRGQRSQVSWSWGAPTTARRGRTSRTRRT